MKLTFIDYSIIIIYLLGLVWVGARRGQLAGKEAFLISGRKLDGLWSGFTIAASKVGGGLLVTYSALVFAFGVQAIWLFVGYIVGYFVFYWLARELLAESQRFQYYTFADYFAHRYGTRVGLVIGVVCTLSLSGWIFTNLIAGGALFGSLTGISPEWATIILLTVISAYLFAGGFHAVVRTDFIQYLSILVILGIVCLVLLTLPAGPEVSISQTDMPLGRILIFFFVGALYPMGSAELWQRVYATRSQESLIKAVSIASGSIFLLGVVLSYVCLKLRHLGIVTEGTPPELGLVSGVAQAVGPTLAGLWLVAYASAIMSSADTFLFSTGSALSQDVLERAGLFPSSQPVRNLRIVLVFLYVATIVGTFLFKSVVDVTFFFASLTMTLGVAAVSSWLILELLLGLLPVHQLQP